MSASNKEFNAMLDVVSHSARILGQVEAAKINAPKDHPLRHIPANCFDHLKRKDNDANGI